MKSKLEKTLGFIAVIFFTFGITNLDFKNLGIANNIKSYVMLSLGAITLLYWLGNRSKTK
jgi:hypothetical protein